MFYEILVLTAHWHAYIHSLCIHAHLFCGARSLHFSLGPPLLYQGFSYLSGVRARGLLNLGKSVWTIKIWKF